MPPTSKLQPAQALQFSNIEHLLLNCAAVTQGLQLVMQQFSSRQIITAHVIMQCQCYNQQVARWLVYNKAHFILVAHVLPQTANVNVLFICWWDLPYKFSREQSSKSHEKTACMHAVRVHTTSLAMPYHFAASSNRHHKPLMLVKVTCLCETSITVTEEEQKERTKVSLMDLNFYLSPSASFPATDT